MEPGKVLNVVSSFEKSCMTANNISALNVVGLDGQGFCSRKVLCSRFLLPVRDKDERREDTLKDSISTV